MSLVLVPNPDDRRKRPRIATNLCIEDTEGGPDLIAHDLGMGGMLVTTSRPRWPGQHIHVRFSLPTEPRAIRATCRVVELVEAEQGIGLSLSFLALAPKSQLAILRYISQALREERNATATASAPSP